MNNVHRILATALIVTLIAGLAACATQQTVNRSLPGTTTTVILTRHADRDAMATHINDRGRARAAALVDAVGHMPITAIYSPDYLRNLETAEPLAQHLGIEPRVVPARMYEVVTTMLTEHPGEVVVWVGNKENLKQIFDVLDGEGEPPLSYGDLYIMTIRESEGPDITRLRYGPL